MKMRKKPKATDISLIAHAIVEAAIEEKNPDAVRYMEQNVRANHAGNIITPILGDVRDEMPKLDRQFDRIIMPYPDQAFSFLDIAFKHIKPQGVIHYYTFLHEKELEKHISKIEKIADSCGRKIEIQNWRRAGSYAPRTWRMVFDILVD